MNKGQQMFHDFYMSLVKDEYVQEAQELLAENFRKQDEGTFDGSYLQSIMPKMYSMIRPECEDKLREAMQHFAAHM